jgi:hypothetical protein
MKKVQVEVDLFEKNDRVLTPEGEGYVVEDEVFPVIDRMDREVLVQHDSGCSNNPSNRAKRMDASMLCFLGKN